MMIAKKPNVLLNIMLAMLLIIAFVSGCTFTGKSNEEIAPLTDEELSYFNGDEFFNGEYMNIRNQFLSSTYERPEKIDMFQLFYCGSGIDEISTYRAKITFSGGEREGDIIRLFYDDVFFVDGKFILRRG